MMGFHNSDQIVQPITDDQLSATKFFYQSNRESLHLLIYFSLMESVIQLSTKIEEDIIA